MQFWMNKAVMIGSDQGTLLVWILSSCCFDHDDVIWDRWKGESSGEQRRKYETRSFWRRVRGVVGTCSRKPLILFWYNTKFKCYFGIFFSKTWNYAIILRDVFSNIEKHKLLQWILCSSLCEFFVVLDYDEMNYNIVYKVFFTMYYEI
jgi:hypothetical protein